MDQTIEHYMDDLRRVVNAYESYCAIADANVEYNYDIGDILEELVIKKLSALKYKTLRECGDE